MRILTDADIERVPLAPLLAAVRAHLAADAASEAVAPPRHIVRFGEGELIFTIGGDRSIAGFRAYQTFAKPGHPADDQVIAAWDQASGEMLGLAVGNRLGALRTGVIGAVAVDIMAPRAARTLVVIGTGRQAETQLMAVATVRDFAEIRIFGRREAALREFTARLSEKLGRPLIPVPDAREAVAGAEVVILATTSETPVIEPGWIAPGAHLSTLGPKSVGAHELPVELAARASLIATDSPQQIAAMGASHMLAGHPSHARIGHLGALAGGFDPDADRGLTLFLSIGLAGTEVACLAAALRHLGGG
jgi:ornithine cyclodeaminase/alanine dehydrogenase-like protein (mu-crystallin family)